MLEESIPLSRQTDYKLGRFFVIIFVLLMFLTYPYALFPQATKVGDQIYNEASFFFKTPSLFILSLLAIPVIVSSRVIPNKVIFASAIIYLLGLMYSSIFNNGLLINSIELMGVITIPLAVSAIAHKKHILKFKWLAICFFIIWFYQICLGYIEYWRLMPEISFLKKLTYWYTDASQSTIGSRLIGFAGNRNWYGAFIVALSPWAFFAMQRGIRHFILKNKSVHYSYIIAAILLLVSMTPLIKMINSMAIYVAFAGIIVVMIFTLLKNSLEKVVYVAFILTLAALHFS